MTRIALYDTTLRDGAQREGISLSVEDKLKIARRLDQAGFDYIEGGWPGSNPKDVAFFERARNLNLERARLAAFGMTVKKGARLEQDANIQALAAADTPVVTLVGKSWDLHVTQVLSASLAENLEMITASVTYFKSLGREVVYDAEHFFDGYKANPDYALLTLQAAAASGADVIVLCDTNGGSMPWEVETAMQAVLSQVQAPLGIHTHDDAGCGVANSLAAVRAGASHVQGTVNGYGERVGNADLCTLIPNMQLKMGLECLPPEKLSGLSELSYFVAEVANLSRDRHAPYVGESAFAHKGGIHVSAVLKNEATYQHIDPALVGNRRHTLVSELSGRGNVLDKSHQFGLQVSGAQAQDIVAQIKELEAQGFTFESAEASVDVMLRRMQEDYLPPFELIDFMVVVEQRQGRGMLAEATVKVRVGDQVLHTAAEGNGPVSALDAALRKALEGVYPALAHVRLNDYKVRIIDSENGTSAQVRVLIDTKNGTRRWSTVGASSNIIEASWQALSDSLEYALLNGAGHK
ncbi:MAG: citramalate synthase [Chloroflexota bacterium]